MGGASFGRNLLVVATRSMGSDRIGWDSHFFAKLREHGSNVGLERTVQFSVRAENVSRDLLF
jgi:hypothetical protein